MRKLTEKGPLISIADVKRHRLLANWLLQLYRGRGKEFNFSPLTRDIFAKLPPLCFSASFLLAYLKCRFSELSQIKITDLKNGLPFEIKSSKSSHIRHIKPFPLFKKDILLNIPNKTPVVLVSYNQLKMSIRRARAEVFKFHVPDIQDCTHIFRHLEASHLRFQKVPMIDISYKLGHLNPKTTSRYIHKEFLL